MNRKLVLLGLILPGMLVVAGWSIMKIVEHWPVEKTARWQTVNPPEAKPPFSAAVAVSELNKLVTSESGQSSMEFCSDEEFLRRAYLRIAGRIPTYSEAKSFLDSDSESKRPKLVDQLLDSSAHASHLFNFWADLFRIQSRSRAGPAKPYLDFVKSAIDSNMRYDKFVSALLTATGPFFEKGNGAAGYLLRDFGMPEDSISNSVRVFLGTRLECAQCHDHPSGDWTRKQYFQMVAFNGGVGYHISKTQSKYNEHLHLIDYKAPHNSDIRGPLMNVTAPLYYGIRGSGTGLARLPEDYQYADGEPLDIVKAKTIFDDESTPVSATSKREKLEPRVEKAEVNQKKLHLIKGAKHVNSREKLAKWMTSKDNPRFSKIMSNRLWKFAMGRGLFDPVDNFSPNTQVVNPAVLSHLEESFKASDYDVREQLRAVFKSDIFQAKLRQKDVDENAGPSLVRLSAEQVWDSLLALTIDDVDRKRSDKSDRENFLGLTDIYETYEKIKTMHPQDIRELVMNIHNSWKKDRSKRKRYYFRLDAQPARFRMHEYIQPTGPDQMMRASELESPAPPGHFLRKFGQSNREQIDNGSRDISATQWLEMMNGFVEENILSNPDSVLMRNIAKAESNSEKIDTVYLSVLSRLPRESEKNEWLDLCQQDATAGVNELVWTLVNSTEFLFVQ